MKRKPDDISQVDWDAVESPPLTRDILKRMRPVREVHPDIPPRVRGPQKAPTRQPIYIRLDRDVLDFFKSTGAGWQTRMNDALKEWVAQHR